MIDNRPMVNLTTVWICTNCVMVLANGDDTGRDPGDPEPLHLLAGQDVVCGVSEHESYCTGPGEMLCACDVIPFSSRLCDGCGDLPGERHAATVWEVA